MAEFRNASVDRCAKSRMEGLAHRILVSGWQNKTCGDCFAESSPVFARNLVVDESLAQLKDPLCAFPPDAIQCSDR